MISHRRPHAPFHAFAMAAGCYAANCALGAAVGLRLVDTGRARWVHHAMYVATVTATVIALSAAAWGRPRERSRRSALALAPATVPLTAIAFASARTRRHVVVALSAAPFFAAGVMISEG